MTKEEYNSLFIIKEFKCNFGTIKYSTALAYDLIEYYVLKDKVVVVLSNYTNDFFIVEVYNKENIYADILYDLCRTFNTKEKVDNYIKELKK